MSSSAYLSDRSRAKSSESRGVGLTSANMKLVTVRINLKEDDPEPEPKLDEGEDIVKRVVEVGKLWEVLEGEFDPITPRFRAGGVVLRRRADLHCGVM